MERGRDVLDIIQQIIDDLDCRRDEYGVAIKRQWLRAIVKSLT